MLRLCSFWQMKVSIPSVFHLQIRIEADVMGRSKPGKNRERKHKLNLVFDETKRREFLGGFHKRKVERRKKAQEELKLMLKEEKRRIKQENKESYKKLVVSSRPIPELEKLLQDEYSDEEEDVSIKIVELPSTALGDKNKFIGSNSAAVSVEKVGKVEKKTTHEDPVLPGMSLEEESESENEDNKEEKNNLHMKSAKDVKRILKHQATKKVQKSKVFQMKAKIEQLKNRKKSRRTKTTNEKIKEKHHKKNKGKKIIGMRKK